MSTWAHVDPIVTPTEPEYRYCTRCDVRLPLTREDARCSDCEGVREYRPRGSSDIRLDPIDPAHEIYLHFPARPKEDSTVATLNALRLPYTSLNAKNEPTEVTWARGLFNPELEPKWPIVVITSYGQVVDYWEGFDLNRLNALPLRRAQAITPPEAAQPCVPNSQEAVA